MSAYKERSGFEGVLVRFSVRGEPKSQPRPRFINGRVVSNVSPEVSRWQAAVRRAAGEALCAIAEGLPDKATALRVNVTFFFGTKKRERWGKPHTHKPDRDNLDKLVLDECTAVGVFGGDDCRVSTGTISKAWCAPGGEGCIVEVLVDEQKWPVRGLDEENHTDTADGVPEWLKKNP
jgi:Holliday junction resolvase RusA-like endonuclease